MSEQAPATVTPEMVEAAFRAKILDVINAIFVSGASVTGAASTLLNLAQAWDMVRPLEESVGDTEDVASAT